MKQEQTVHINNGWGDIGYNFCIGPQLNIMTGRNTSYRGAHTLGSDSQGNEYNSSSIGVCVFGNYETIAFSESKKQKLIDLLAWLCYSYNIMPSKIIGHRDAAATLCPGANLYNQLNDIRNKLSLKLFPDITIN